MKHPALTRLFAIVLAVLCLTMVGAGLGSAGGALSARRSGREDVERLTARIDEYRQILGDLEGGEPYKTVKLSLEEQTDAHEDRASQHRMDLAIYTATRSGVRSGLLALAQADAAMAQGKAQFEEGRKLFEEQETAFQEGYQQFQDGKRQLAEGRKTLEAVESALSALQGQLDQIRAMSAILDSDDENARQELTVAAYDEMLQSLDTALGMYSALKDQGGISAEQMQMLAALLEQQSGTDIGGFPEDMEWQGISAESLQELEDLVFASTGMSVDELRAQIREQRESIADMDPDEPISEEQYAAIKSFYSENRVMILAVTSAMEQRVAEYEVQIRETKAQLDAAQKQIDEMEPMMEQGKEAIEQGRAAMDQAESQIRQGEQRLAQGHRELDRQAAELEEKAELLRQEKKELDAEALRLEELSAAVEARKELEQREVSVRLMLLDREDIQDRVDGGMELLPAAEDYAAVFLRETESAAVGRLWVSALLILGGIAGFLGIPAAFEKTKSRFALVAPVLLCFGLAVGAEALCRFLGRGDSYSALATAVFAAVQLMLVLPKKKAV